MKAPSRFLTLIGCMMLELALRHPLAAAEAIPLESAGWQGPRPGAGLPDAILLRQGHEACAEAKRLAARPTPGAGGGDSPLLEDDPLTWYDVTWYELDLEVYQGASSLSGSIRMHLTSLHDNLDEVVLHAAPNLTISAVEEMGDPVLFTREGDLLLVQLPDALDEGGSTVLEITYSDLFNGCGVLSTWRTNVQTGQNIHTITTQAEPFDARCFWPCKDDTRDKADSTTVRVTTDDFNSVVSNGVQRANVDNGDGTRTVTWFEQWPMVTYLVSLCVTEYNHAQTTWSWNDVDMPMHDWSWGLSTADQQSVLEIGLLALTGLSERYGLYPYWNEKYGHAQYTWGGAMEHQTCTSMGFYGEAVVAHELSHQWFGDKVTCDTFHDIWLNEGWATYSEAVYYEYYYGEAALHEVMSYNAYLGPGTIYVENPETDNIFDGNLSYAKGSWVPHMLRHIMGEEPFWAGVHAYLGPNERPAYRTSDTDGFRALMEAQYGGDLSWFFDEWIHGEYWPDYAYHWSASPAGEDVRLDLQIIQSQVPQRQVFNMPIDLRVTYAGGASQTYVLGNEAPATSYTLLLDEEPVSVELDPDHWILCQVTELDAPPATNVVYAGSMLLDPQGLPLERIPAGGAFRVEIFLSNLGEAAAPLGLSLTTSHPDVELTGPASLDTLGFGETVVVAWEGTTLDGISGMVPLALSATWAGGQLEQDLLFPAGHPEILLVDDDGGDAYETWYMNAMDGALDYEVAASDSLPEDLAGFGLILWITGDARRALAEDEWTRLIAWRDAGGHLVFSGQNFADAQGPDALAQRLGVELLDASHDDNAVMTRNPGIFGGRPFYLFNGGAGNQDEMDVISGITDCMAQQATYNGAPVGSAAEELICGEGGLVTFGFGLEGLADIGNGMSLAEALQALAVWSRDETGVDPAPTARPGAAFTLLGAHPNPFNPATTLDYEARRAGVLRGEIVNLAGQRVDLIAPRQVAPGRGRLTWQAEGRASGLYLARLELVTPDGTRHAATVKLMLMR